MKEVYRYTSLAEKSLMEMIQIEVQVGLLAHPNTHNSNSKTV